MVTGDLGQVRCPPGRPRQPPAHAPSDHSQGLFLTSFQQIHLQARLEKENHQVGLPKTELSGRKSC